MLPGLPICQCCSSWSKEQHWCDLDGREVQWTMKSGQNKKESIGGLAFHYSIDMDSNSQLHWDWRRLSKCWKSYMLVLWVTDVILLDLTCSTILEFCRSCMFLLWCQGLVKTAHKANQRTITPTLTFSTFEIVQIGNVICTIQVETARVDGSFSQKEIAMVSVYSR